jgi:hypothetical protein
LRSRSSNHQAVCILLVALASVACSSVRANVDQTVQRDRLRVQLEELSIPRPDPDDRRVQLAIQITDAAPNTKLLRAVLSSYADGYCSEGVVADRFGRSGSSDASAPLARGERLMLEFPHGAFDITAEQDAHLNLLLQSPNGARRCVTLPLGDGRRVPEWRYDQRFTVGVDFAIEGLPARLGSVDRFFVFPLSLGVWLDRYHLHVFGGIAGAGCPEDSCAVDEEADEHIDYATAWMLGAGVDRPLWEHKESSFGISVRYRALHLAADTFDGRESFWTHGPVIAPYLAVVPPFDERTRIGGSRSGLIGFDLPVGYLFAENGDRSLSVGFTARTFFNAF